MSNILNHIPGFRSRKVWKMIIAWLYYFSCVSLINTSFAAFLVSILIPFFLLEFKGSELQYKMYEKRFSKVQLQITNEEIGRYLYSTQPNPTFLLDTKYEKSILSLIISKGKEIKQIPDLNISIIKNYYEEELSIFLRILSDKGIRIKNKEGAFIKIFIRKIRMKNYDEKFRIFGYVDNLNLDTNKTIVEKNYYRYIEIFYNNLYDIGNLDFLSEYLTCHIGVAKISIDNMKLELSKYYNTYIINKKKENMNSRFNNPEFSTRIIDINIIDKFNGIEFENFLKDLFLKLGYKVEGTKTTGDQGVDLVIDKNFEVIAVQAKCYNNSVGNFAIQEVVAGKAYYKADKTMVITNNYFTKSARKLADATDTILWDRDKLIEIVKLVY